MPRVEQVQQKALEEFRERNRNASKRKKQKNSRQFGEAIITFVCLFFLLSLLFLQVAKKMTPKIDTSIGSNAPQEVEAEPVEAKGTIDDRLKLIQFNDTLAAGELRRQKENDIFNEALDERVILPKSGKNRQNEDENATLNDKVQDIIARNLTDVQTLETTKVPDKTPTPEAAPVPETPVARTPITLPQTKIQTETLDNRISAIQSTNIVLPKSANYKVLVGRYQTAEQAQLAKTIIRETSLGQNAFVKLVDNVYTIQIGSYSTQEQAATVANELTTKSFPARVYYEKPQPANSTGKTIF